MGGLLGWVTEIETVLRLIRVICLTHGVTIVSLKWFSYITRIELETQRGGFVDTL